MNKALFFALGGLFLIVLIAQNLVYLGVPVRISAWLLMAAALLQGWLCHPGLIAWRQGFRWHAGICTLPAVILLTIIFHGIVPVRQGLEWYYGKGYADHINYVALAEFLKEEPYSTSEQDVGLRPWMLGVVGLRYTAEQLGMSSGPGLEINGLKKERIGQSIITAVISVWSGTDGKGSYAATFIFALTLLAICLYAFLRDLGIDRFLAGAGALLAAVLPAVTRLSLNGFLSQVSILFVFPFFASLLRRQELSARSFTIFFSLTLAYLVAAYSELAPLGLCTFFFGVMFVRRETFRLKRLMLMSAILLIGLANPFYLRNLIEFLGRQFYYAAYAPFLDHLVPKISTLRGWSELIFGAVTIAPLEGCFECGALSLGLLFLAGPIYLAGRDRLILGTILLPVVLAILYLATRANSSYPIGKITLSILPFMVGLAFVALSRLGTNKTTRTIGVIPFCTLMVAAAAVGSARYYSAVLHNEGLLAYAREHRFLNVCQQLEKVRNKRVLIFETHPLLTPWLCYHARHNDVYFDARFMADSAVPQADRFSTIPDLAKVDFVATRDRLVDLRAPSVSCLTFVDDTSGEDRRGGHVRYGLGPPAALRFLALRPISANLTVRLAPGPDATVLPIDLFLTDDQGHVFQGKLTGANVDVRPINLPRGLSTLQLAVRPKDSDRHTGSFPVLAELDEFEVGDIR